MFLRASEYKAWAPGMNVILVPLVIAAACTDQGISLFRVAGDADGLTRTALATMDTIMAKEQEPMVVIEYQTFVDFGRCPRSSDGVHCG